MCPYAWEMGNQKELGVISLPPFFLVTDCPEIQIFLRAQPLKFSPPAENTPAETLYSSHEAGK